MGTYSIFLIPEFSLNWSFSQETAPSCFGHNKTEQAKSLRAEIEFLKILSSFIRDVEIKDKLLLSYLLSHQAYSEIL